MAWSRKDWSPVLTKRPKLGRFIRSSSSIRHVSRLRLVRSQPSDHRPFIAFLKTLCPRATVFFSAKGASSPQERAEPTGYIRQQKYSIFFQPVVRMRAN
jgi:hypothetical protein